jgi:hypothetical protein
MDFLTTKQASKIWGITSRRIALLCEQGRVEGAVKAGAAWIMPANTPKPVDRRVKSGKYVGVRTKHKQINKEN